MGLMYIFINNSIKKDKWILKTHQISRNGKYNVFTEEISKISLSLNNDKII